MAELQVQDKVAKEQVYVTEDLEQPLLGREPAELLKLISRLDNLSSDDYKSKVADKYPKLFVRLGVMKDSYCITLKEDVRPFQVSIPRKVPFPLYQKLKKSWTGCWRQVTYPELTNPLIGTLPWW